MSVIRTAQILAAGENQFDTTSGGVGKCQHEVKIPLNQDGSAVVVTTGGAIETAVAIRADAVLTNAYVLATVVDMSQYNYCRFRVVVGTAQAKTCNIKVCYGMTSTVLDNFQNDAYALSGSDYLVTSYDLRYDLDMTVAGTVWACAFFKRARYIGLRLKSDATTTGTISATAQRFNA